MSENKLNVIEKGKVVLDLSFENGSNILESNFSEDISNMINTVKVYNGNEQEVNIITNSDDISSYGTFSKVLKLEDGKDINAEAKKELKTIERKASITGFGDSNCKSGYGVKVKDAYTGLVGLFYIDEDTHTWEEGIYKVDLTLAFENMMNEVNAETNENSNSSLGGNGSSSSDISSGSSGSSSSEGGNSKLVDLAESKLGCKYVWGATGPNTFDCSGLMLWCHKQLGISIPRTSLEQSKSGKAVSKSELQVGDLVFFKTTSAPVGHVGMYIGNGEFIHAANSKKGVIKSSLKGHYDKLFVNARRP
jgi:cell wall-associated NlpC family hydrolase